MTQAKLNVEYFRSSTLVLCYTDQQIQAFCDRAHEIGRVAALLEIPRADAVRALAGLAPRAVLVAVSAACAQRASEYAATTAAAAAAAAARAVGYTARAAMAAATDAAYAAARAADAAAYAAARAADAAARAAARVIGYAARAEYQITIRHYCSLMGWE